MRGRFMEYRVNNLIYAAEKDLHNTIRTIFEMTEPVNGDMLRDAADLAITRYPYFSYVPRNIRYSPGMRAADSLRYAAPVQKGSQQAAQPPVPCEYRSYPLHKQNEEQGHRFYSSRVILLQPVRNITTGRFLFL